MTYWWNSMTIVTFHDFPRPENNLSSIPHFPRCMGTLQVAQFDASQLLSNAKMTHKHTHSTLVSRLLQSYLGTNQNFSLSPTPFHHVHLGHPLPLIPPTPSLYNIALTIGMCRIDFSSSVRF